MIPLFQPSLGQEEAQAVNDVMASGWLGLGPRTARFEDELKGRVGAEYCVATSSASAALHLAVLLLRPKPTDEILLPALTFVSTAHAVRLSGARPILVDVDERTLTTDPADVERKMTARTKAIITVDFGGHPSRMDELRELARAAGVHLIEDAAHSLGAVYKGRPVGSLAELTCFSFQAVKPTTTGEGGAITTASSAFADRLQRLRSLGIDRDTWERKRHDAYDWAYDVCEVGFKYHMSDVAAAIGLVQLAKIDRLRERRQRIAARYDAAFAELRWLDLPKVEPWARSAHHNYAVRLEDRSDLARHLREREIATGVHYRPIHHLSAYRGLSGDVPVVEREWQRLLLLPAYPDLSADEQARIIDAVFEFGRARGL